MAIPEWIRLSQEWIVTLSPIMTLLILVFWKPAKFVFIRIYNHFVKAPDEANETEIDELEERIQALDDDLKRLLEYRLQSRRIYVALLHHEIFQTARRALSSGEITESELENLEELYQPYKELGGNGTAEKLYHDCLELPIFQSEDSRA